MPIDPKVLEPAHLAHLTQDVQLKDMMQAAEKAEVRVKERTEEKPEEARKRAMQERSYTFQFRFPKDPAKPAQYEGTFTSTVPNVRKMQQIGILRAQLNAGLPPSALDGLTNTINMAVATLMFTLDTEKPDFPPWARDLRNLDDVDVITAIYEEVVEHQQTFLGRA